MRMINILENSIHNHQFLYDKNQSASFSFDSSIGTKFEVEKESMRKKNWNHGCSVHTKKQNVHMYINQRRRKRRADIVASVHSWGGSSPCERLANREGDAIAGCKFGRCRPHLCGWWTVIERRLIQVTDRRWLPLGCILKKNLTMSSCFRDLMQKWASHPNSSFSVYPQLWGRSTLAGKMVRLSEMDS